MISFILINIWLTVCESLVRDVLGHEHVLSDDFIDLLLSLFTQLIVSHIDLNDVSVAFERVFQCIGIGVIDEVARNINSPYCSVYFQELSKGFTEHMTERV